MSQSPEAEAREIYPGVTVNPQVMGGTPVIKGRRVPVEVIVGHLAAGDTVETVREAYNLTQEEVQAALGYAAHAISSETIYVS